MVLVQFISTLTLVQYIFFQNENKMKVIQAIIVHDVIGRPKIVLDQLREGLATLGFASRMKEFPELFQELFVPATSELTGAEVIGVLEFPSAMDEDEVTTHHYLKDFLLHAKPEILRIFLIFTTGAICLPNFGLGKIGVKFEETHSVFASTCCQSVTLPKSFTDEVTFSSAMLAVIDTKCTSFNCV